MADPQYTGSPLSGLFSFFADAPTAAPSSAQAMAARRRIAEALVAGNVRKGFPKTVGEGLTAIGDALGERSQMRQLAAADAAYQGYIDKSSSKPVEDLVNPPNAKTSELQPGTTVADTPEDGSPADAPVATARGPIATPIYDQGDKNPMDVAADSARPGVNQNVASWYDFARRPSDQGGLGLGHEQAVGVVANLQAESGAGIQPWGATGDSGTAQGAAQWRMDRLANLQKFAAAQGLDHRDQATQQAFMRHEMLGSGAYGGGSEAAAYQRLAATQDPEQAATAVNRFYERSADRSGRREAGATRLANALGGPRDNAAAILAARGGPPDAQDARLAEVAGLSGGPTGAYSYPAVASRGDVQSDAPPIGLTGGPGPAIGNAVTDTIQSRMRPPPAQGVPQPNPTLAGSTTPATGGLPGSVKVAQAAANNPPIVNDAIQPQQAAPGIPEINRVTPPVTMPPPGPVQRPQDRPLNAAQTEGLRMMVEGTQRGIPELTAKGKIYYDAGTAKYNQQQQEDQKAWEAKLETERQRQMATEAAQRGKGVAQAQLDEAVAKANVAKAGDIITKNTGLPANVVMDKFDKDMPAADRNVSLLRNARLAKQMFETGVVSGTAAGLRVDIAKARALWGNIPEGELASRSERALAATNAMVGYGLNQYQPGDTRVTNSDTIVSGKIVGGDPSQQEQTRKELVNMVIEDSNRRIAEYERRHGMAFQGTPAAELYRLRTDPIHDDPKVAEGALKILMANPGDQYNRDMFDRHFGPGSAELEIARAERRARAGGR